MGNALRLSFNLKGYLNYWVGLWTLEDDWKGLDCPINLSRGKLSCLGESLARFTQAAQTNRVNFDVIKIVL